MRSVIRTVCALALLGAAVPAHGDVVAARTLRVGTVLAEADLEIVDAAASTSRDRMIGMETRRAIYAGRKVVEEDLGPVTIVHRNDVIRLEFSAGGLGLRTEARALDEGGIGEIISVMNVDTRVVVQARILGPNQAGVFR